MRGTAYGSKSASNGDRLGLAPTSRVMGAGGGLYWVVPATVLGFGGAVLNAWVLLVEIVR